MSEEITKLKPEMWRRINWLGVIAGALTLALPFMGTWWRLTLGMDAVTMFVSPFGVEMSFFGEETIISPLFWWFCLGLKLGVVYLGVLLLLGSVLSISDRRAAIAEYLVRFSARKLLWLVVAFVAVLVIVITLVNHSSEIFSSLIPDMPFQLQSELPYLVGKGELTAGLEGLHLSFPISMELTRTFAVAIFAAALGCASRVYQKIENKPLTPIN